MAAHGSSNALCASRPSHLDSVVIGMACHFREGPARGLLQMAVSRVPAHDIEDACEVPCLDGIGKRCRGGAASRSLRACQVHQKHVFIAHQRKLHCAPRQHYSTARAAHLLARFNSGEKLPLQDAVVGAHTAAILAVLRRVRRPCRFSC